MNNNRRIVPRVVIASSAGVQLGHDGNLLITCVNCREEKTLPHFGIRYMKDIDEMRSQSWCNMCRAEGRKESAP